MTAQFKVRHINALLSIAMKLGILQADKVEYTGQALFDANIAGLRSEGIHDEPVFRYHYRLNRWIQKHMEDPNGLMDVIRLVESMIFSCSEGDGWAGSYGSGFASMLLESLKTQQHHDPGSHSDVWEYSDLFRYIQMDATGDELIKHLIAREIEENDGRKTFPGILQAIAYETLEEGDLSNHFGDDGIQAVVFRVMQWDMDFYVIEGTTTDLQGSVWGHHPGNGDRMSIQRCDANHSKGKGNREQSGIPSTEGALWTY